MKPKNYNSGICTKASHVLPQFIVSDQLFCLSMYVYKQY